MSRFGRFLILALLGFALGAGLAYWQNSQTMSPPVPTEVATDGSVVDTASVPTDAAPAADAATPVAGSAIGGAFALKDHNGVDVTEASWPGKLKLVFFGFTNCPDICPAALDKLTSVLNGLGVQADQIQPLFITIDPARDTPEAMKAYLVPFHSSFVGLTGTEEQVKAAEDAYKVYAAKGPEQEGQYTVDHSAYVYLMSADNQLLQTFSKDDTAEAIAEKIKMHLTEVTPATEAAPAAVEGSEGAAPASEPTTGSETSETPAATESAPESVTADPTPDTPAGGLDAPSTSPTDPVNTP